MRNTELDSIEMQEMASNNEVSFNVSYPNEWEAQNEDIELKLLPRHSKEWSKVSQKFHATLPRKYIVKIERIQNKWLWEKYYQHCHRMKRKNDGEINEQLLFHGTRKPSPVIFIKMKKDLI